MSEAGTQAAWEERAADRSPLVQRSKTRSVRQARLIVDAGRRLMSRQGEFTTQELVKEAGVALQTFYRYFEGKDALLVAVLEDLIAEQTRAWEADATTIADPIARLHFYVTRPLMLIETPEVRGGARAITAEHWRLHQLFPDEMAHVDAQLVDLIARTLDEAAAAGTVDPLDSARDAWLIVDLVRGVYHHYAYAAFDRPRDEIAEHVWSFCLRAVGGTVAKGDPGA
jgi:AcrR family transcriptional regulator